MCHVVDYMLLWWWLRHRLNIIHTLFPNSSPKDWGNVMGVDSLSVSNFDFKMFMQKIKDPNVSRSKHLSVVIQLKLKPKVWLTCESAEIFTSYHMLIINLIKALKVSKLLRNLLRWIVRKFLRKNFYWPKIIRISVCSRLKIITMINSISQQICYETWVIPNQYNYKKILYIHNNFVKRYF